MATAAILIALFTTITIALLPHQVPQQSGDGICPACDPSAPVVPANLRHEYYFEESVGGAGDGATALWFVPLVGVALGARAVTSATHRPPPDRGSATDRSCRGLRELTIREFGVSRETGYSCLRTAEAGGAGGSQPGVSVSPRLADTPGLRRPGVVGPGRRPGGRRRRRGRG